MAGRDATSDAINRLGARITEHKDQQNERIDKIFARLEERFDRLEAKVDLKVDRLSADTHREIDEARRDVGELRDLVAKHGERIDDMEEHRDSNMRASAEGAAKGAGEAAGVVAAQTARVTAAAVAKGFWATWLGKLVAGAVAFTAVVTGAGAIPSVLRWVEKLWTFVVGK